MIFRSILLRVVLFAVITYVFNPYLAIQDITTLDISLLSYAEQVFPVKNRRIVWMAWYVLFKSLLKYDPKYFNVCVSHKPYSETIMVSALDMSLCLSDPSIELRTFRC